MKDILFHGSTQVIDQPKRGLGNPRNDYGPGFYCTHNKDLAGEWACKTGQNGFINKYEIDLSALKILDLMNGDYSVLNWIALLLQNRTFLPRTARARDAQRFLVERFAPKTRGFDIVKGYRADDSYFSYAEQFVENSLSVEELNTALFLGKLGVQTVLISEKAFSAIAFLGAEVASAHVFAPMFVKRDREARESFLLEQGTWSCSSQDSREIFVRDIMKGGVELDSLPRMLSC